MSRRVGGFSCGFADAIATLASHKVASSEGATYGEKRVEIYEGDVVHYPVAIRYAHSELLAQPWLPSMYLQGGWSLAVNREGKATS